MNLQDEILEKISKEMAGEIDFSLLADALVACGWTRVILEKGALPCTGPELHEWRERNLTGEWRAHNRVWLFENSKDALIFTLKWVT
jgi:hypothetical protein